MPIRVTQNSLFDSIRQQIAQNQQRLLAAQEAVSSGKRINRLSDDPVQGPRLLQVKSSQAKLDQYLRNLQRADSIANVYDAPLGQADDLLVRAKELLLGESNEVSSTPQTREAARLEIQTLTSQLVQIANTKFEGDYVFSGYAVNTPAFTDAVAATTPAGANTGGATVTSSTVADVSQVQYNNFQIKFTAPGTYDVINTTTGATVVSGGSYTSGVPIHFNGLNIQITDGATGPAAGDQFDVALTPPGTYQGDGGQQQIAIQDGAFVPQNLTGDRVFQGAGSSGGVDVFSILNQVATALNSNDRTAMNNLLSQLDTARGQVDAQRSLMGSHQNLVQAVQDRQNDFKVSLESIRSGIEDADLSEAITKLTQQQTAYQASLGAAAKISNVSLLDFLK